MTTAAAHNTAVAVYTICYFSSQYPSRAIQKCCYFIIALPCITKNSFQGSILNSPNVRTHHSLTIIFLPLSASSVTDAKQNFHSHTPYYTKHKLNTKIDENCSYIGVRYERCWMTVMLMMMMMMTIVCRRKVFVSRIPCASSYTYIYTCWMIATWVF